MCGITGFIDFTCESSANILKKMNDAITHRGPDNEGVVVVNDNACQLGFGHRRLSIIDLSSAGNQPMTDGTGNYIITFNGEIYNYKEIKTELQTLGVKFHSSGDTEVILNAYIKWGMQSLHKFIGMYAFALYDKKRHKVFFCRDRVGVKPFYYYADAEIILFGSELKSIMTHPAFRKQIDFDSLGSFLRRGWIAAPKTIFKSTYKLKPGHYIEIDLMNKQQKEYCYWNVFDYYNMDEIDVTFNSAKEQMHELLTSACNYRMVADTEVGIFLSGGIDSSIVTAILQHSRGKKINTFSIGFDDEKFNEAPHAKAVAEFLGTDHHEFICSAQDALNIIPELPFYYDEPFADSSAIPTMLVSKMASQKVKVALSADGGDEVFGGYPRYYQKLRELQRANSLSPAVKKILSLFLPLLINFNRTKNPQYLIRLEKLQKTLKYHDSLNVFRFRSEPILYSDKEINDLINKDNLNLSSKSFYDDINLRDSLDPSKFMMALEYKTTLPDDLLVKVDRASMAFSLEAREPLLDHRLVELSARLNSNFHFRGDIAKNLLKEICYAYIPKDMLDRPKKGFSIPTNKWLNGELKEMVLEMSSFSSLLKQGIFNAKYCTSLIDNYYKGYDKNGERIWFFLMFQMWYNTWMN